MKIVQLTPGAGGMYCGNCLRDNALASALRREGHEVVMLPLYLPMTLDEPSAATRAPTFFGGVNVFLSQHLPWYRRAPGWLRRWLDAPGLLKWAAGRAAKTRAADVGELNLSMLQGEEGGQVRELEELITWLKENGRPDAVILSNALLVGFVRRLRRDLGTRVFVCLQGEEEFLDGMREPWRTRSWKMLAERGVEADGWIAPSRFFGERMAGRLGVPPGKLSVAYNGIRLDGYDALPRRSELRPGEPISLGFFARMCREKGLDIVVDAFLALRAGGAGKLRLLVGGGCGPSDLPLVEELKARLAAAGLQGAAEFHPNVSREAKIALLARCDVLTVPARQTEDFGLYLIESLAAGTPVVQPRCGPFPELIADTGGGVLFDGGDAAGLAAALTPLLAEPGRLRELGARGREAVQQRFSDTAMARRILAVIGGAASPATAPG